MIMLTIRSSFPWLPPMGYDPIWFGVVIVLITGMGVITPPVGINVYVVAGVAKDVPLQVIFSGPRNSSGTAGHGTPLILFPAIALWLPGFAQ